jgi:hypothetical protein
MEFRLVLEVPKIEWLPGSEDNDLFREVAIGRVV